MNFALTCLEKTLKKPKGTIICERSMGETGKRGEKICSAPESNVRRTDGLSDHTGRLHSGIPY